MAIKIASWNVECRLHGYQKSGRGTAEHILKGITALDADVIVLPEFYMDSLAAGANERLKELGYKIFETAYDEVGRDKAEQEKWGSVHIGVLSRLPISAMEVIRPGNLRNLVTCMAKDPKDGKSLRIIATHLDDRTEALRLNQVKDLIKIINKSDVPTVVLGDFNAMWPKGRALFLRSRALRFFAKAIPQAKLRSVVERVTEMAKGEVLTRLATHTKLQDADQFFRPTTTPKMRDMSLLPSIRLVQIDHMLVSPEIAVESFMVGSDGGSDHRPISAIVSLR